MYTPSNIGCQPQQQAGYQLTQQAGQPTAYGFTQPNGGYQSMQPVANQSTQPAGMYAASNCGYQPAQQAGCGFQSMQPAASQFTQPAVAQQLEVAGYRLVDSPPPGAPLEVLRGPLEGLQLPQEGSFVFPGAGYGPGPPLEMPSHLPPGCPELPPDLKPGMPMPVSYDASGGWPPIRNKPIKVVKLPRPRFEGGPRCTANLNSRNSTFARSEVCSSDCPGNPLAPNLDVPSKTWTNTYVYVPERTSHTERQFLERFVPGENGEWLDYVKASRMSRFIEAERIRAEKEAIERQMVLAGIQNAMRGGHNGIVERSYYTDAYSGETLLECKGQLVTKNALLDEYNIHQSASAQVKEEIAEDGFFDFDNLRFPWFFPPTHNKKVMMDVYNNFDRSNMLFPSDRSYQILSLPSCYTDADAYNYGRVPMARAEDFS